jgi:hypothetical protein
MSVFLLNRAGSFWWVFGCDGGICFPLCWMGERVVDLEGEIEWCWMMVVSAELVF